jgi:phosphatidylserine synthase
MATFETVTPEAVTLWVHIAAGVLAIAAGFGALATEKGGLAHRRAGKGFVASMAVVVGTVPVLLAFDPTDLRVFLTLVAVFSGYLAFSGYRVLSQKRPAATPESLDWAAAIAVVVACVALAAWGASDLLAGESFGVVLVVFGAIGVAFGGIDVREFRNPDVRGPWLVTHLQRMIAALIATVSAVSAVNLTPHLGWLAWLWPTILGSPLIAYYSWKYE